MRILVGWDSAEEAQLIEAYLSVDDSHVTLLTTVDELLNAVQDDAAWDIVLLSTSEEAFGVKQRRFEVFEKIRRTLPDCPVVGACKSDDIFQVARFITRGMRTYVIRDEPGDYLFLLKVTLDNVVAGVAAERDQLLAAKLRDEIESVRKLQESILPVDLQGPPNYDITARYEPSQIRVLGGRPVTLAGGDYYDVFGLDDDRIVLLVGDASGHGMKACMSIMTMHTLVRMMRTREFADTASFVSEINRWLCGQSIVSEGGGFITLLYGVLDTAREEFVWTSAGHPIPILQDLDTNEVKLVGSMDDGGLPLAIIPDAEYEIRRSPVPPNSRLLICSDGMEEAFFDDNDSHQQFGIEGIMQVLKDTRDASLSEAVAALFETSSAFTKGAGRHDDTTVILVERR